MSLTIKQVIIKTKINVSQGKPILIPVQQPDPPSTVMPVNFAGRPHNRNLLPDKSLCT